MQHVFFFVHITSTGTQNTEHKGSWEQAFSQQVSVVYIFKINK